MEKSVLLHTENYLSKFKMDIQLKAVELSFTEKDKLNELLEFIFEYEKISFESVGCLKKSKNAEQQVKSDNSSKKITEEERCIATRKQGDQCSRKKTKGNQYCGTHCVKYKEIIHGKGTIIDETSSIESSPKNKNILPSEKQKKSMEVVAHEIQGIIYYIDNELNVYNTEDIFKNLNNPRIIAKAVKLSQNVFSIPSLGL
jgi:hypothetical protein